MLDCKAAKTPMYTFIMIWIDPDGKDVNTSLYIGMFGSLMYLTAARLTSCVPPVYVQDIKNHQRNLTLELSNEFSET